MPSDPNPAHIPATPALPDLERTGQMGLTSARGTRPGNGGSGPADGRLWQHRFRLSGPEPVLCCCTAAHILPSVRVSAGGSRHTCALTPPALTERPGGRHMAGACTADGLMHARNKNNENEQCSPAHSAQLVRASPDAKPRSPVHTRCRNHEHVRARTRRQTNSEDLRLETQSKLRHSPGE